MVLNQNGIFEKTEQATTKYGKERSREELTLALSEVQAAKYEQGLTGERYDEKLDGAVNEIGQIDNDEATVEGHIWQIDRSVPKIIDYIGEDDGIEIRYKITGNETWTKIAKTITANVTVKNNKGALDISSIKITKKVGNGSETDITSSVTINRDGTFALITSDITETIFTVSAKNSEGKQSTPRTIKIIPKVDNIPPILSNPTAVAEGLKIKISVNAVDDKTGVQQINYTVVPTTVKPSATGTLTSGQILELTADEEAEGDYIVSFTATDEVGNTSSSVSAPKVIAKDSLTVLEAKEKVNASTLQKYIGTKISNYKPSAGGKWRVFYFDAAGDFGPQNTLYLKRDYDSSKTVSLYSNYLNYSATADGIAMMKRMNPLWEKSSVHNTIDNPNEKEVSWLCDTKHFTSYKTSESSFAIGAPSVEMFMKAYNVYKQNNPNGTALVCKLDDNSRKLGYLVGANGSYSNYSGYSTAKGTVEAGKGNIFAAGNYEWLASPSSSNDSGVLFVDSDYVRGNYTRAVALRPIVPLDQ